MDHRLERLETTWTEVLWAVADGKKTEYDALRWSTVDEFFRVLQAHQKRIKQLITKIKEANHG